MCACAVTSCLFRYCRRANCSVLVRRKHTLTNAKNRGVSSNNWLNRQINDPYVIKAKQFNYRSRSAFKLLEIQERYAVIKPGDCVLDCGCAPGGWSQVALQHTSADSSSQGCVVGVDVQSVLAVSGIEFIRGDFTSASVQQVLLQCFSARPVTVIISDMAPKASGVKQLDHDSIVDLCYSVIRFSMAHLAVRGSLLLKLWAGGRQKKLETDLSRFFQTVKTVKPPSSRADSAEIFLLCTQFRGAALSSP